MLRRHGADFESNANDTQLYLSMTDVKNNEAKLSRSMEDVCVWRKFKQLKMNEDKTKCLIVVKSNEPKRLVISRIKIIDSAMAVEKAANDLGVIINCNLSFKDGIKQMVRTTECHLKIVLFVKKYLVVKTYPCNE